MYREHIGWTSLKVITWIISLGSIRSSEWMKKDYTFSDDDVAQWMTLDYKVYADIGGVPWKGASYNSEVIENVFFSDFRTLHIRHLRKWGQHYYIVLFSPLSPFRWPQYIWPWMTLNGLKSHFTSYVHYYELPRTNYLLLIYCSLFITRVTKACDQRRSAGSGIAKCDPQNIGIHARKICGSSVDAISSEP